MTTIRVLGDRNPSYPTHRELDAALALMTGCEARWYPSDAPGAADLRGVDGLWAPPGTPYRDDGAVLAAIRTAREQGVPFLATCGGFQYAAVEFARNAAAMQDAAHAETDPSAPRAVVSRLSCSLVAQTRTVTPVAGTRLASIVGTAPFEGSHWCNYGVSPEFLPALRRAGLVESAHAPDAGLEAFELPGHPFFVATLFQPQMGTTQRHALHPLIAAFLEAAARHAP